MSKQKLRERCTADAVGTITLLKSSGFSTSFRITVVYTANGNAYECREFTTMKSKAIKLGFLPIGQRIVPILGNISVGSKVRVKYNPDNPAEAYLPDNVKKSIPPTEYKTRRGA